MTTRPSTLEERLTLARLHMEVEQLPASCIAAVAKTEIINAAEKEFGAEQEREET